jgi:hypothetical protein
MAGRKKKYKDSREKDVSRFMNDRRHAQNRIFGRSRAVAKVLWPPSILRNAGSIQQPLIQEVAQKLSYFHGGKGHGISIGICG